MPKRPSDYQNFFDELSASAIHLPVAVQDELAAMVQRAYSSQTLGVPQAQIGSLPIQHELLNQYLPNVNTIGGIENALQQSMITPLLGMTQRLVENRGAGDPSAIFSDLYAGTFNSARNYDPTKSTFSHFAAREAFQAGSSAHRREFRDVSVDQFMSDNGDLLPGAPSSLTVPDPQLDSMLDDMVGIQPFTPATPTAPYVTPAKRWYDPLTTVQNNIPSPFYAPEGQGLFSGAGINPNLVSRPGPGLQQVSLSPEELRQYVNGTAYAPQIPGANNRHVQQFLRQTAEGLRGGGFISTDEEVIGSVAGLDDVLVGSHRTVSSVHNAALDVGALDDEYARFSGITDNAIRRAFPGRGPGVDMPDVARAEIAARGIAADNAITGMANETQLALQNGRRVDSGFYARTNTSSLSAMGTNIVPNTNKSTFGANNDDFDIPVSKGEMGMWDLSQSELPENTPEELSRVVEDLRATNPTAVQSGELIAEGRMKSVRLEDKATYNQGRSAVQNAVRASEQTQRVRMNVAPTSVGQLMDSTGQIPTLEQAVAAVKRGLGIQAPVDNTPAVPEPEPPSFGNYSAPEEPPMDPTFTEPVSDVGNAPGAVADFEQPAQAKVERVRKPRTPVSQREIVAARQKAVEARNWINANAPEYRTSFLGQQGRSKEFAEFQQADPDFAEKFKDIMADVRMSERTGGSSVLGEWVTQNNVGDTEPASSSAAGASPVASVPASSNGSRGGSGQPPVTTTSAPAMPEEPRRPGISASSRRSDEPSSEDLQWLNEQDAAAAPTRSRGGFETTPLRVNGEWSEEQINRQMEGMSEERAALARRATATGNGVPLSNQQQLLTTDAALSRMMNVKVGQVYREGNLHGVYGMYKQQDRGDPDKGGDFINDEGRPTLRNSSIEQGQNVYQNAVSQAFGSGGLDGLSNREFAATIHKRVQEGITKIVDDKVKEWNEADPESSVANQALGKHVKAAASAFLTRGDAELRSSAETDKLGDVNMNSIRAHGKQLAKIYNSPDGEALKERVDELGGLNSVSTGPRRVLMAGDQSYEVGADEPRSGGGSGSWSDRIKSIYQTNLGHGMMAQFMASMAWKSTGGAVMESATQWGTQQYGYNAIDNYGGGELGPGGMAVARQEMAANRSGSLAYQQYGMFSELGYAIGNLPGGENLLRAGNDLKMAGGVGAVAGIGTWGIGALAGSTALTAAALPVGLTAAGAIGLPSFGMTAYNAATGQDSYSGASWKNMLAKSVLGQAAMEDNGYFGSMGLMFAGTGAKQESWSQEHYGTSAREVVSQSKFGELIGQENVNWLFEGRDEKSETARSLLHDLQKSTGLKEDVLQKQIAGTQVMLGGLDSKDKLTRAQNIIEKASDQGVTADMLLSQSSQLASQRGIFTGTDEFGELANNFANLSPLEQQKEMLKSSRDYQKYAQWSGYLQGGNAEAYGLYDMLGGTNAGQTQAIQSIFSQAQMNGTNLTPELARSMAIQSNSMAPFRAMDIAQMSSSMFQIGAGSFAGNFSDLAYSARTGQFGFNVSDVGNLAGGTIGVGGGNVSDTMAFLKGVTSGNQYALSDYGRMAGIGVLQSMDPNGLQTGLKDMSGLLAYAQQDILRQPTLTGAQTLSGLGMNFSATDQSALLNGGIWGYQQSYVNQTNAFQAQSMGLQFDQLAQNKQFMYSSWGLENQQNSLQWASQQASFAFSGTMMDTQHRFQQEDAAATRERMGASNENTRWTQAFNYQTSLMQREWSREDYQYNTQMRGLQQGWGMEDLDEQIRRSSGYDRAMLIKQRDRATLSNNLGNQQAETQFERQEETWKREDERYAKSLEFSEKMIALDESNFERNQRQAEEMYQLQKNHLAEEIDSATKLHDVRMEMEQLQRDRQEEQLRNSEASLNIQKQMMELSNEYQNNMTIISHTQTEMEASLRKITSYSPAFSRMLTDFLSFLEDATKVSVPTGGAITYQ